MFNLIIKTYLSRCSRHWYHTTSITTYKMLQNVNRQMLSLNPTISSPRKHQLEPSNKFHHIISPNLIRYPPLLKKTLNPIKTTLPSFHDLDNYLKICKKKKPLLANSRITIPQKQQPTHDKIKYIKHIR